MFPSKPEILDVRLQGESGTLNEDVVSQQIVEGLSKPPGSKTLPTMLLYNERGLRLYDAITVDAPEYYLFGAEESILKEHADDIVRIMHGSRGEGVVLELGAGSLRKTSHLLRGLSHIASPSAPITYYALDLEERELERTLGQISDSDLGKTLEGKVETKGIWGTYDEGLAFVAKGGISAEFIETKVEKLDVSSPMSGSSSLGDSDRASTGTSTPPTPLADSAKTQSPLHILFLGSSLGNFSRTDAIPFLRNLPLRPGSGDTLLIGMDHDNDKQLIETAYNDPKGLTTEFIMNGLKNAGKIMGDESMFDQDKWEYVNTYNEEERRHEAYYKSKSAQTVIDPSSKRQFPILENEMVNVEMSHKFSDKDAYTLFTAAHLRSIQRWMDPEAQYSLWLLERPPWSFPLLPSLSEPSSAFGVPTIEDWTNLWATWDCITRGMIPKEMLFQKPIDLRHICLFYFGHIPTFLDIHLSRMLNAPHTEPENFKYIFERGIDPNVDDPSQCHSHSEVPTADSDWPSLESILAFQTRVRTRLLQIYADLTSGKRELTRKVGRVLAMVYEHEAFHAETLLYMLLQRAGTGTLPPPSFTPPPWESLSATWDALRPLAKRTVILGPTTVSLGHDDLEVDDLLHPHDVETHEFGWDNETPKREVEVAKFEIEWRPVSNGEFYKFWEGLGEDKGDVKFPVSWVKEGEEVRVRTLYGPVPLKIARDWPIVTSYNNLSTYASVKGGRIPTEAELRVFLDQFKCGYEGGANVGFRNWHPTPATTGGARDGGKGHNGGVWEWTSTPFEAFEGFVPSTLYPENSVDFFDGAHQAVIGGSYATIPRLNERRSLRNWYQRNYPYPWVGARIVYDISQ